MRSRIVKAMVTILTVTVLLVLSCGPKVAPTAPAPTPTATPTLTPAPSAKPSIPTTPTPAAPVSTPIPAATEKPKYGGSLNLLLPAIEQPFDSGASTLGVGEFVKNVYEQLLYFDWDKGLAGSGEIDWGLLVQRYEAFSGQLAESWEVPEIGTWVIKVRRGVHWALNPASEASRLMNGREFTADDVVWNVRRNNSDPAYPITSTRKGQPAMAAAVTAEKTGPWEVTIKTPVDPWTAFFWVLTGGSAQHFYPPEVVKKYGNVLDWRNAVGTGPYMVSDFVPQSAETLIRNQNYWGRERVGPGKGDQLPYIDTIKLLFVPDISTRLATMRTGRGDWVSNIEWEDAKSLIQTNPKLQYKKFLPQGLGIGFRLNREDLPFKDKRVRQALMMATDFEAMKNDLYGGQAEILVHPVGPNYDWLHTPMEKLPESVQVLYKYNPQRAKQLLAEAGYPSGFKAKLLVENRSGALDPAAVFKAMWAKVGVDVELQPRETAVFASIKGTWKPSFDEMIVDSSAMSPYLTSFFTFSGLRPAERLGWSDPVIETAFQEMQKYVFLNMPKANEIYRKTVPYIMEQAYFIPRPTPYSYTFWQPWVMNYHGEYFGGTGGNINLWPQHAWIDRDLKEKITGRR